MLDTIDRLSEASEATDEEAVTEEEAQSLDVGVAIAVAVGDAKLDDFFEGAFLAQKIVDDDFRARFSTLI